MKCETYRPPTPRPVLPDAPRLSYGTVDILPPRRPSARLNCQHRLCCFPNGYSGACRAVLFLLAHGVMAWVVGLVLIAAVALCVALLPLCGVGVLLFRQLFRARVVDFFAKCDAALVNYVAAEDNQIQIDPPRAVLPLGTNDSGQAFERLVSGLDTVSAESAMVLVYFTTIRLVLATVGLWFVSVVLALPLVAAHTLLSHQHTLVSSSLDAWQMICAYVALTLLFVVAVLSMDVIVGLCRAATHFFCCERVYALPLPRTRATLSAATRPNVVVIRLPPSASGVYAFATSSSSMSATTAAATSRGSS